MAKTVNHYIQGLAAYSAFFLALLCQTGATAQDAALNLPRGEFVAVAIRSAGDVAGGPVDKSLQIKLGDSLAFGERLHWWNGETCDNWSGYEVMTDVALVNLADPVVSDLWLKPVDAQTSGGDRFLGNTLRIRCGNRAMGTVFQVDRRVLVLNSPSGNSYVIFEKSLTPEQVLKFQQQLADMKFLQREATSEWTPEALRAVAAYAEYRGAKYRFERAAITENLLDGLGVI